MILEALAVLVCPVAVGVLLGMLLRWLMGRRTTGVAAAIACLMLPTAAATAVTIYFPLVGLWDGVTEGSLCGAGLLFAAHRLYADARNVLLTVGAVLAAFLILEVGARLFLGNPPAYPLGEGPYFLLSTVLRTTGPDSPSFLIGEIPSFLERNAMQASAGGGTMADRPPAAMVTREIVCSIAYGSTYSSLIATIQQHAEILPEQFSPRPGVSRHVLHVGDSMVFGANVSREQTFTANLEKLEPDAQHINGGISGTAPDDYLVVLRSWIAHQPVDLAVMYLFAGNDLNGLDAPHPCSDWQPILTYEDGHASLRFPIPKRDPGIGLKWLMLNSPLPYLARVMIVAHSTVAAFMGGVLDSWSAQAVWSNSEVRFQHLESILRSARDELREKQIPLVVVVLPAGVGTPNESSEFSRSVLAITQRLGLPALDATEPLRDALSRGEHPIQPDGSHFNEAGHRLMANWLHERLATIAGMSTK